MRQRWGKLLDQGYEDGIEENIAVFSMVDDVQDLLREQARIDRMQDAAGARYTVVKLEMTEAVPGERGDRLAECHAQRIQGPGQPFRAFGHGGVGRAVYHAVRIARDDLPLAMLRCSVIHQRGNQQRMVLHQAQHDLSPCIIWPVFTVVSCRHQAFWIFGECGDAVGFWPRDVGTDGCRHRQQDEPSPDRSVTVQAVPSPSWPGESRPIHPPAVVAQMAGTCPHVRQNSRKVSPLCHGRPCAGHPRLAVLEGAKSWMPGPGPAMTQWQRLCSARRLMLMRMATRPATTRTLVSSLFPDVPEQRETVQHAGQLAGIRRGLQVLSQRQIRQFLERRCLDLARDLLLPRKVR